MSRPTSVASPPKPGTKSRRFCLDGPASDPAVIDGGDARSFDLPEDAVWGPLRADAVALQNVGLADGGPMFHIPAAGLSEAHPLGIEAVDSLAQLILVVDLVAVTGLSPSRLALARVGAAGRSPHQFVLQLRLERAGNCCTTRPTSSPELRPRAASRASST